MPPYQFMGEAIGDPRLLVASLARNWEDGKKHLFRGLLAAHFRSCRQEWAEACLAAEEEASRANGRDDIIYWRLLYKLHPELKEFYWRGRVFAGPPALGRDLLERLWRQDRSQDDYYESVLAEKLLTAYAAAAAPQNEPLRKAAAALEEAYLLEKNSSVRPAALTKTFYLTAYTLSGQKLLNLDGRQLRTVGELAAYLRERLAESFAAFEGLCRQLVDYDGNLDLQLEAWLITIGKQQELDCWRALMRE
jgi:hypothetical protein